ncbi:MAG: HNH endonuclease [Patescibacteria group bacterium]|nr:HNH endonuclease [Patescibacteria group bacterium]
MTKKLILTIEMVPASTWGNNLRKIIKPKLWEEIKKAVFAKSKGQCAVCKQKSKKLHAHEVWRYDDKEKLQILKDIVPLCTLCHMVKHMGFAGVISQKSKLSQEKLISHFCKVNNVTRQAFQKHYASEIKRFEERSKYEWQVKVPFLERKNEKTANS